MAENKAVLIAYEFDDNGLAKIMDPAALKPDSATFTWLHLNGRDAETKKILKDILRIDPLIAKSLLAEETRPRLEEMPAGALLLLRGINFNAGPEPEDLVSIRMWISGNHIISVGRRKSKAIADMDARIHEGRGPKRVGEFVSLLATILNDGIEPAIHELDAEIDRLEDETLEAPDSRLRDKLSQTRKQATLFRRHLSPQRDVISRLQKTAQSWMLEPDKWFMQDNLDRITRFVEELDTVRERSQILQDEINSALSSRLNKNLYMLSVITVVFMPLTFITGLLGMNVEGIPGAHHPAAFGIVCAVTVFCALVQLWLFKKMKWF